MKFERHIFVFGSNQEGAHGKGAALVAAQTFGAVRGVGEGLTGDCYAIPTKGLRPGPHQPLPVLSLSEIERGVRRFVRVAALHEEWRFNVTKIACGLAGYTAPQIAPFFFSCRSLTNVYLPEAFVNELGWSRRRVSYDERNQMVN